MVRLDGKTGVETGQESRSTAVAWSMVLASARRSSVTSRSWKVSAMRSTRPLAWGERAKICRIPSSCNERVNWVASAAVSGWRALCLNPNPPKGCGPGVDTRIDG